MENEEGLTYEHIQEVGFSVHEKDSSGEIRLQLDVNGHVGDTWLSYEMWKSIGEHAGWIKSDE